MDLLRKSVCVADLVCDIFCSTCCYVISGGSDVLLRCGLLEEVIYCWAAVSGGSDLVLRCGHVG